MIYTPRTKVRITVPKAPESDKNKFVRDTVDRNNMKLTSKAMNILSKYGVTAQEAKDATVAAFSERTSLVGKLNNINEGIRAREEHLF